jgi:uncharacterized protein with ParB-like and HNH nuclease domain
MVTKANDEPDDVDIEVFEADEDEDELADEGVVYQINTFGADYTVDGLIKRFDRGDIFRPQFQRNFVWSVKQASRFVESILLGLPIPSVFLYRENVSQKHLIVDGLQRLTTLHAYYKGRFEHNDRVFRLRDVHAEYDGKTLDELDEVARRRFEDSVIHAMVIQQLAPEDDNSSAFHIFDRLNSNGTPLQPQEIRAAIYHGPFQDLLGELNSYENWRLIFGPPHKRSKDQELILRFFALLFDRDNYEKPMKTFLNKYMKANKDASAAELKDHKDTFEVTIDRVFAAFGKGAFRPRRTINVAVFDSIMVAIAECPDASTEQIQSAYQSLLDDDEYVLWTSKATSDEKIVDSRIERAIDVLNAST